jgi:hypothetical protein
MGQKLTPLQQRMLDESLHELGLPVRIINALETNARVFLVKELLSMRPAEVLALPNFGQKTLDTIYEALAKFGFYKEGSAQSGLSASADSEDRRRRIRDALGGSAGDDWDAEIIYEQARARKRRGRKPKE